MGSGVVYYEYEAHKEYDDVDVKAATKMGTIEILDTISRTRSPLARFIVEDSTPIILTSFPLLCSAVEVPLESLGLRKLTHHVYAASLMFRQSLHPRLASYHHRKDGCAKVT
ncbi:hypothetical protein PIB30_104134 [Stylosanthes scabra]|uniref:Uncharacterized protein n=1 Tax=Stylosanthes scabra TaxID=79078 RepID=A0ABU6RZ40_9FABA|nr:hypothetical protein [Stylosanthes scabra]